MESLKTKNEDPPPISVVGTVEKISNSILSIIDALSKQKLKIALISYYYENPVISGVGIHARALAKYLAKHNCNVHVFCNGKEDITYKENGVTVHSIAKILTPMNNKAAQKRLDYDLFESEVIKEIPPKMR